MPERACPVIRDLWTLEMFAFTLIAVSAGRFATNGRGNEDGGQLGEKSCFP